MKIEQIDHENKGYFKAIENGKEAGRMTYSWTGKTKIIIDHTEVNDAFRGKSVGKKMVMAAVDYARKNHIQILPLCPYAKSVFDRTEEIHDVLGK